MQRLDYPLAKTGDAAFAAGVSHQTLLGWLDRGLFELTDIDRDTPGSGVPRLFTLRRVYQLAVIVDLAGLHVPVRFGAALAAAFTDVGDAVRGPGELFPAGPTLLVSSWPWLAGATVVNNAPPLQVRSSLVVDCRAVVAAVHSRLAERGIIIPSIGATTVAA